MLVSLVAALLVALAAGILALRRRRSAEAPALAPVETWGCGFSAPTARMQYSGSSFAELLLQRFSWAIHSRAAQPRVEGSFPRGGAFHTEVPDTVLDLWIPPATRAYQWLAGRVRLLQLPRIQFQMLLVLVTLVLVLAWGLVS
jgi:hypothetical protein